MSNNYKTRISFILLFSFVNFLVCYFLTFISIDTLNQVKKLNENVATLKADKEYYESIIQSMSERVTYNNSENNESNDILSSDVSVVPMGGQSYSESDLNLLARLIESESGNQSFEGKLAVGTVVMNRVDSEDFPDTIKDVIFQKRQFSVVSNGTINNEPSKESLKAAKQVLEGTRVLDSNVLYFYNPKLTNDKWIKSLKVDKTIEDHNFAI